MHIELKNPTPSLAGGTELLVLAPLRKGLVPSLDAMSYKTRTKLLLKTLHAGRKTSHEYQLFRALSDAVERVGVIHSVRVAVLEPQDQVLLSVNFDGAFESYVRVIWQKASRLLDLIFCNTEDYKLGWRSSYPVWRAWLESVRVDTPFFYALPGQTYQDAQFLRMHERHQRCDGNDLALARLSVPTAERIAWDLVLRSWDPTAGGQPGYGEEGTSAGIRQGLQGLAGIYRLADAYPPGTGDGQVLLDAAHELLPEFSRLQGYDEYADITDQVGGRFVQQLSWFRQPLALPTEREAPALQPAPALPWVNVQAGILKQIDEVSHGCVCIVALDGPAAAAVLLDRVVPQVTRGDADLTAPGSISVQLGFTAEGLRACGLVEAELDWLPLEFRQGMDGRAGLLGDIGANHPRRWTLPLQNWPAALDTPAWAAPASTPRIAPQAVHLVLQLRFVAGPGFGLRAGAQAALAARAHALLDGLAGVRPLSVQWMARATAAGQVIDHFGFTDGQSQPVFDAASAGHPFANQIAPGEVLIGHDNAADHAADLPDNLQPDRRALLRDGSYLVVRKLRQNVGALRAAVQAVPHDRALVLTKMMGRWPLGHPQAGLPQLSVPVGKPNDFDYSSDPNGDLCPLSAHIRLANPRLTPQTHPSEQTTLASIPGGRAPRLIRRSMPYGPVAPDWPDPLSSEAAATVNDDDDRGLMFMAYNASIGEQFEVVQRWLSGANSSGAASEQSDPFLGVPQAGRQRHFRFVDGQNVVRMALDGSSDLAEEPTPLVALQWGLYLLAPALSGLAWLGQRARSAAVAATALPWSATAGEREIAALEALAQSAGKDAARKAWKLALEDVDAVANWRSASIWAAIRQFHGGVLDTPYGVLVGSRALVEEVLRNTSKRYTVDGYQQRLAKSIGPIYLGEDDGTDYRRHSTVCNAKIQALRFDDGYGCARNAARAALANWIQEAKDIAIAEKALHWELTLEVRELVDAVLAEASEAWFGLSEADNHFKRGSFDWQPIDPATGAPDSTPRYPGDFTAVSRATFQPWPEPAASALAQKQGQALRSAMRSFLAGPGASTKAPVTRAVLDDCGTDIDRAARTLVGALMGMFPTTAGSLRRILGEWLQDGQFWQLRSQHAMATGWDNAATAMQRLHAPLLRTMQARPVPELIWRTALHTHLLQDGTAPACSVEAGRTLVLGLVSATQQGLQTGADDVIHAFGGDRNGAQAPTHACPGYLGAMGLITGTLAALIGHEPSLRPGPAPGVLYFDGPTGLARPQPPAAPAAPAATVTELGTRGMDARPLWTFHWKSTLAPKGKLLGWGDSWIFNAADGDRSLGEALAAMGWDTSTFPDHSRIGMQLKELASQPVDTTTPGTIFHAIAAALQAADDPFNPQPLPRAILVSGGGNDVHKRRTFGPPAPLRQMLNSAAAVAAGAPFFTAAKDSFIVDRLSKDLRTVLNNLTGVSKGRIPILIHGYDHPIPDGRRHSLFIGPWLKPVITDELHHDETTGCALMRELITAMNNAYAKVVAEFAHLNVHHARLTETLEAQAGYATDHTLWWANELHPTPEGFAVLANKLLGFLPAQAAPAGIGQLLAVAVSTPSGSPGL